VIADNFKNILILNRGLMKTRLFGLFLLLTLVCSAQLGILPYVSVQAENVPDVFVGIDIAYGGVDEIKQWVGEVGSYTNVFVLGCTGVTQDRLKLEEACQYLFDKDLFFIVYQDYPLGLSWISSANSSWLETAKARWGSHFLGFYYTDEVGGRQLDLFPHWVTVEKADNYSEASRQFNMRTSGSVNWFRSSYSGGQNVTLFTSDYALYQFDYQAGYDVLLAQFGWNYSRQLNAALCRGAATTQGKQWGVIVTWTYMQPPYIGSGEELYNDLLCAYDNGAKYILVFDSNKEYTGSILKQEHLDALKHFWQYSQQTPRKTSPVNERTAYILPKDYAYGFRGPNDKIWGLWEADSLSAPMSLELGSLLQQYDSKIDIVYQDALGLGNTQEYKSIIYWNSSALVSPTPQQANSKIQKDAFSNPYIIAVFVIVSATLAVALSSKFFLKQKRSKSTSKIEIWQLP
jgi:hypothetical protein